MSIPRRLSLSAQATDTLRKAIHDETWAEFLPSERRLCEMLQVSRPTIRTALHNLAKEGLISIQQGKRNKLLVPSPRAEAMQSRLVGLVTMEPVAAMSQAAYQNISEMRAQLAGHGFVTEFFVCQVSSALSQRRKLEEFIKRNRMLCCVLLSVSVELQRWFAERSFPALVLGSCHQAIQLPSLDTDYRSVCRHAAGIFLSRGHRRVALVVPNAGVAGDIASEEGFREAFEHRHTQDGARAIIIRHNGSAQSISNKLDMLFNSTDSPTALLVAKPQHVFIVVIYLLRRGLAVPDKVSLIARDHDHIFEAVSPTITHYMFESNAFENKLIRMILQLASQHHLPPEANLLFPKFFPGGTVKQLSSSY
jgi:DNA-binding LacI/PurR family transcriptional regulator